MAASRQEIVDFVAKHMKKNPGITMSEAKALGKKKGYNIYPLIMGLARKELGLGRPKKKATRKRRAAKATARATRRPGKRGPGRPRKVASDPASALSNVVSHMRDLERENQQLRAALGKMRDLIDKVN